MIEKLLGSLLGAEEGSRVEVIQVAEPGETPTLEIRLLHDCGELGWVVHRRIHIAAGQAAALRDALNMMDLDAREAKASRAHLRLVPTPDDAERSA